MSILKSRLGWSLALGALLAAPQITTAAADAGATAYDLSLDEAQSLFSGFGVNVDVQKGTATLKGFVHRACLTHVGISQKSSKERSDFVIRDLGGLKGCIEQQRKANPNARLGDETIYARLSEQPGASVSAKGRDLTVGFAWLNLNVDPPRHERADFETPVKFQSKASLELAERRRERLALEEQLARCEDTARTARGSEEKEIEALAALRILERHDWVDEDEAAELRQDIAKEQLKRLREQIAKATVEEFSDLDSALMLWAQKYAGDDQGQLDAIASLRMDLAEKMSRAHPSLLETQETALRILQDISDFSEASAGRKATAAARIPGMKGNIIAAQLISAGTAQIALQGQRLQPFQVQHLLSMQPEYQSYLQDLSREVSDHCMAANRSRGRDRTSVQRCQEAQATLAREPQRVLTVASQEVSKALAAMTPQQPAPQQPLPQQVPGGPNTLPYPYRGAIQPALHPQPVPLPQQAVPRR